MNSWNLQGQRVISASTTVSGCWSPPSPTLKGKPLDSSNIAQRTMMPGALKAGIRGSFMNQPHLMGPCVVSAWNLGRPRQAEEQASSCALKSGCVR